MNRRTYDRDRAHDLARELTRVRDLANDRVHTHEYDPGLRGDLVHNLAMADDLVARLDLAVDLDRAVDLDPDFNADLNRAGALIFALGRDLARAHARARDRDLRRGVRTAGNLLPDCLRDAEEFHVELTDMPRPERQTYSLRVHAGVCATLGAVGGALVFLGAHRALIDDAFITLDYARTLAQHGQWALEPGHPSNTATSPLNVLLLAALIALSGAPVFSVGVVLVTSLAATGVAFSVICAQLGRSQWHAAVAVSLLVVNPLLISTIGLETYLGLALLATLGAALVAVRPVATGVVCGLLMLTRADLITFALATLVAVAANSPARSRARSVGHILGVASGVALPWFAVSWWWLGSAVPDTLLFKVNEVWVGNSFATGLWHYELGYPLAVGLSAVPAAAGLVVVAGYRTVGARRWGESAGLLAVVWGFGAALNIALYLLLRPPPYHWYYGPATGTLSMLAALGVGVLPRRLHLAVSTMGALLVSATVVFLVARPWTVVPISSNWASASEYVALAARVPPDTTVETFGEVGTVAYYCDCTVVDRLADRAQVADLLRVERARAGPVLRTLLDWNYYRFKASPPIRPEYKLVFAEDSTGVHVTSWRPYAGQMVVRPAG